MTSGVYEILNTVNGKRYIGSTNNFPNRWRQHWQGLERGGYANRILQNAWNKYGMQAFEFKPLLMCAPTNAMLRYYEQRCLDVYKPEYNIAIAADAPMRGRHHTAESNKKNALAKTGKTQSAQTIEKRVRSLRGNKYALGMKHTPEWKAARSAARTGVPLLPEHCANISKGKTGKSIGPQSAEVCAKKSLAQIGRKHTPEAKEKIGKSKRGIPLSPEWCGKLSLAHVGVPWSVLRRERFEARKAVR